MNPLAPVAIPISWLEAGYMTPTVCRPHGNPARRLARARFISARPGWTWALMALSPLVFVIVSNALRTTATSERWPVCGECVRKRRQPMLIGYGLLAASLPAFVASMTIDTETHALAAWAFLAFLALFLAGAVLLGRATVARVAGGQVVDRFFVRFRNPHPAFADQVNLAATTWVPPQGPSAYYPANPSPSQYFSPN